MELTDLKNLKEKEEYSTIPDEPKQTSLLSYILFRWTQSILYFSKPKFTNNDTVPLPDSLKVEDSGLASSIQTHNLFLSIILTNLSALVKSFLICSFCVSLEYSSPVYMDYLIKYLSSDEKPLNEGLLLIGSLILITLISPLG